jgi:trigger factor
LDARHNFALPLGLVESEFNQIWDQLQHAFEHGHPPEEDVGKSDEELKAEYHKIAERRVRLGLVLAEVGRTNNITITDEEINRAIGEEARRYPGQERKVYQHYQENPQALAALRAPLYEDKVVDFILELAEVTERKVSKEELMRDPETGPAEAHEHDHDHDHEKKAKRARGKEAEKKEPEKKAEAQKSAKARAKPAEKKEEKAPAKAAKPAAKGASKKSKS